MDNMRPTMPLSREREPPYRQPIANDRTEVPMAKRKEVTLLVRVTVPADMTKTDAAREVRTLINDQCNWSAEPGDVRARACKPAKS